MRRVVRLSVTPVKSMRLHHPPEIRLERYGALGNRSFYVAEPDGRLVNNSKLGPLMAVRADYDPGAERLTLRFPDGSVVEGDATSLGEGVTTDFYGRSAMGRVLEGPWTRVLTRYAGRPLRLIRPDTVGDANDDAAASVFSTASAEELARRSGRSEALDSRRFRMLIEVGGCEPHEEDGWTGRQVRVGEAVLEVVSPVARCVITTKDPDTGRKDFDTLEAIAAYRGLHRGKRILFGVYADVVEPGTVRAGDPVEPD